MTAEVSIVTNLDRTHGIVPLAGGQSACVTVEHTNGRTRIIDVVGTVPDAEAKRWLQEAHPPTQGGSAFGWTSGKKTR